MTRCTYRKTLWGASLHNLPLAKVLFLSSLVVALEVHAICKEVLIAAEANPHRDELARYENTRVLNLDAAERIETFQAQTGITVVERDAEGNATKGKIRILVDNPGSQVLAIGPFNEWGKSPRSEDYLRAVEGTPYFEGEIRGLRHGMEYRLLENGQPRLDASATTFTDQRSPYLNSIFWDFHRPGAYHMQTHSVDLRGKPSIMGEVEAYELIRYWQGGPGEKANTYRYIADSGVIEELKRMGYNSIEFLPFTPSIDGDSWHLRYQVYGNFGPDFRYGTPEDFKRMVDKFNQAGIAVVMDSLLSHYPHRGNEGARNLERNGVADWRSHWGRATFGDNESPWGTSRYDYANPHVRRFLTDGVMTMLRDYGISGIRFDNMEGIRGSAGGDQFLRELVQEVRKYRPEAFLNPENFSDHNPIQGRADWGMMGMNVTNHTDHFYEWFQANAQKRTEEVDMSVLQRALRHPMWWGDQARISYITNHDEASNPTQGASGAYVATLLKGGDESWGYVVGKTRAFASIAMLSGSAYLDMPQMRLLQEGTFYKNPGIRWDLLQNTSQRQTRDFFSHLSWCVRDNPAFAFHNTHPNVENHTDANNKVVSLLRINYQTGKRYVAVINLNHNGFENYQFGLHGGGRFKLIADSDRADFGGSNRLQNSLNHLEISTHWPGEHGKSDAITLPYLPPYGVLLFEEI